MRLLFGRGGTALAAMAGHVCLLLATPIATPLQGGRPERPGLLFRKLLGELSELIATHAPLLFSLLMPLTLLDLPPTRPWAVGVEQPPTLKNRCPSIGYGPSGAVVGLKGAVQKTNRRWVNPSGGY